MRDSEQVWFEARRETSDGLFDTDPDGVIRSWENHDYFRRKPTLMGHSILGKS